MSSDDVPVEVRAHAFERFGRPLAGAIIRVSERPTLRERTGRDGEARFWVPAGSPVTAIGEGRGCQTIQAATVMAAADGLGGERAITLQVPLALTFAVLRRLLTRSRPGHHHLATTITAAGKTLADSPQGEPGARLVLLRLDGDGPCGDAPIYLGAAPLIHKTDFVRAILAARGLARPLDRSSVDGGVLIANLPRGRYLLTAQKPGVRFSEAEVRITEDSPTLINSSPPYAPRVLGSG